MYITTRLYHHAEVDMRRHQRLRGGATRFAREASKHKACIGGDTSPTNHSYIVPGSRGARDGGTATYRIVTTMTLSKVSLRAKKQRQHDMASRQALRGAPTVIEEGPTRRVLRIDLKGGHVSWRARVRRDKGVRAVLATLRAEGKTKFHRDANKHGRIGKTQV